jgi:hypothetical protein
MTFFGMAVLTAIGTAVLAVFAIVTAWYARKAFRKQAQAARVFLAAPRDDAHLVSPHVHNASELPIYDAKIRFGSPDAGLSETLGMIMPGDDVPAARQFPADQALQSAFLTFRDAAGVPWARMSDGMLFETFPPPEQPTTRIPSEWETLRAPRTRISRAARAVLRKRRPHDQE